MMMMMMIKDSVNVSLDHSPTGCMVGHLASALEAYASFLFSDSLTTDATVSLRCEYGVMEFKGSTDSLIEPESSFPR